LENENQRIDKMSSDSILNRIDSMLGKKKKEELPTEPLTRITTPEYFELTNIISKSIKEQSLQIHELKEAILLNNEKQSENIIELNTIIEKISSLPQISTKVINANNIKSNNIYTIIKKTGTGNIRDIIISVKNNFYLSIKADNTELFNMYSFDELTKLAELSSNILTKTNNEIKTLSIKNISFNSSIDIYITSDVNIKSNTIIDIYKSYCMYDIKDQINRR
jgi:hypothetical protein